MDGSGRFSDERVVDWLIDECRDAGGQGHLLMWLPLAISLITSAGSGCR